ncbi:hypothetical protein IIU_06095 [Bacillus cereus VD133]|uniref:Uncharacterized protein n=1 Tax=Bacillus cereus VD133 TaxID=1053233 RepID=A0A9W5PKV2_BACCE|nr:hypothetical protein [Bacillus cereus]EOO25727.1 hypothetical protein IIU_06095 [Bacillus cereus VD133]
MSDKKRDSFFWNLKKIENEEFFKWFESQSNIADSLYKLVCYFIDKYGLQDAADYKIQQQMQREILLQDANFLNEVKRVLLNDSNFIIKKEEHLVNDKMDAQAETDIATDEQYKAKNKNTPKKESSTSETVTLKAEYEDLDTSSLFGN